MNTRSHCTRLAGSKHMELGGRFPPVAVKGSSMVPPHAQLIQPSQTPSAPVAHSVRSRHAQSADESSMQQVTPRPGSVRLVGGASNITTQNRSAELILPTSSIDQDVYTDIGTSRFSDELHHHPIMELLMKRAAYGSRPGMRAPGDRFKLGLVVEGGGMRGIVSGAMLMALDALGMRDCFDAVYGASAGAINLTYFLSGQRNGLEVYTEDLTGSRFINFGAGHLLRGGPVMDLDYLVDHVMHKVRPLDWRKVLHSPVPLKVVASSLDSLSPVLLEGFSSKQDLVECLKASATVPQIAGPPRRCRGHQLVDAAIFEPVPLRTALRDGCTHVLVLCTRPATLHTTWRKAVRGTVVRVVKRTVLNAPYMRAAWNSESSEQLASQDEELVGTLAAPPDETLQKLGAYVMPVYPECVGGCNPVTTDARTLKRAEAEGWRSIASLFSAQELLLQYGDQGSPQMQTSRA